MSIHAYNNFFQKAFATPQAALDLVRNILPQSYWHNLDPVTVTVIDKSYISANLKKQYTDLLISCTRRETDPLPPDSSNAIHTTSQTTSVSTSQADLPQLQAPPPPPADTKTPTKKEILFYFLVEHKSYQDRWSVLQILRYCFAIWNDYYLEHKGGITTLPEIVPVLFYHDTPAWGHPLQFADLVAARDPHAYHQVRCEPIFVDLKQLSLDKLFGSYRAILGLTVLGYLKETLTPEAARNILETMRRCEPDPQSREFFAACIEAFCRVKEKKELDVLLSEADKIEYTTIKEDAMTYAEELILEGQKRGKLKGKIEDKQQVLVRLLNKKFGLSAAEEETISRVTDIEALDRALDEIITSETKADVLALLQ